MLSNVACGGYIDLNTLGHSGTFFASLGHWVSIATFKGGSQEPVSMIPKHSL